MAGVAAEVKVGNGFRLPSADVAERLVGGKTARSHCIGHRVRHQGEPDDLRHVAAILEALSVRAPNSRDASVEKTRPMVTHNTSWVASESSLNS